MRRLATMAALGMAWCAAIPLCGQGNGAAEPPPPAVVVQPSPGAAAGAVQGNDSAARPGRTGLYRISGFVLSGADSHPLRNAAVQIQPVQEQPGTSQKTTTDENGFFTFSEVGAGMFHLQGSADGYLTTLYEQHGMFSTGIVTGAGVDTESLILKLQPEGSLLFTVLDENGEPVEHANIHLFRDGHNFGEDRRVSAGVGSSDDLGRYQFLRLAPGTYFAAVMAQPWYALHPNAQLRAQQPIPFGFVDAIDPSLDVAYPVTYYPGVTDSAQAAAIQVRAGEDASVQVQLRPEPALSISVPGPPEPQPQSAPGAPPRMNPVPQVFASVFGEPVPMMTQASRLGSGETVITGLAAGQYELMQAGRGPMSREGGTPVHLTDHSLSATASPNEAHVTVQLRMMNGDAAGRGQILLMHDHRAEMSLALNEKGVATFDAPPGEYYFSASVRGRQVYVRQVLRGDRPLGSNDIQLAAGQTASYTVTAIAGTHTVRGVTQTDGRPAHGIFVLMLPTAELHSIHAAFREQSDLDGSFQLTGVPPGDYSLFAIQDGWTLNWGEASVLDQYVKGATPVHIGEDAAAVQTIPAPVAVQAR